MPASETIAQTMQEVFFSGGDFVSNNVAEGTTVRPVVLVDQTAASALTVNYTISGTATPNVDYTISGGTVNYTTKTGTFTIPAGTRRFDSVFPLTVSATGDDTSDANETIILTLVASSEYTVPESNKVKTIKILEDTGDAEFALTGTTEAGATLTFVRTKSDPDGDDPPGDNTDILSLSLFHRGLGETEWSGRPLSGTDYQVELNATYVIPTDLGDMEWFASVLYRDGIGITKALVTPILGQISANVGSTFSRTSVTINEGASDSYTVKLASQPTELATMSIASDNTDVTVMPASLTFTFTNWNEPQVITVTTIKDDDEDEDTATLTHTAAGGGYGSLTATVTITVTDGTPLTVAAAIPNQRATESIPFTYVIPAATFSSAEGDVLSYTATQADDSALPGWLNFDERTRTFSGTPQAGDVGTLTVKVTATNGEGESVFDTFDITIRALPVVTIIQGTRTIAEGTAAVFAISALPPPDAALTVNLTVSDAAGSDFIASDSEGMKRVNVPTSGSATYTVATMSDDTDDPDGPVTVTVNRGTGYFVGTPDEALVMIRDDDPTVVSLARTGSGAVSEGDTVTFTVILGRSLIAGDTLDVPLSVGGNGVTTADWRLAAKAGSSLNTGVTLSGEATVTPQVRFSGAGADTATLVLTPVVDGQTDTEPFNIALGPTGTGTNGFDRITLNTNVGGGAIPNGSSASFTTMVNNTNPPAAPTGLTVTAGDEQATLSWMNPNNRSITRYEFQSRTDRTFGWAIIAGSDAATTSHVATNLTNGVVHDFRVRAFAGSEVGTASDWVSATPRVPEITTTAGTSPVTEGTAASFTVTATPAPAADLTVNLSVAEAGGGDFVASSNEGMKMVMIPASSGSVTYTVTTVNDNTDEPDGSVTVTVTNGTGYTVGTPPSAMVVVNDDDDPALVVPVVTIVAGTSPVTEGTAASFTVTATPAPASNLDVNLSVTEAAGSDFVVSSDEGMKTVMIPASGSVIYTVATVNDDTDEPDGSVTVTIAADGSNYTVGDPSAATVMVNDDDEAPLGIEDTEEALIFPNPSGRYLEVRSSVEGRFQLLSLSGKPLLKGMTNTRIDITSLRSGLYLVQLPDGQLLRFVRE